MCILGLYYLSHEDRFVFQPAWTSQVVPSIQLGATGDGADRRAGRLVNDETVEWMRQSVEKAFTSPQISDAVLSRAIGQFHRVRACLESDAASEPLVASEIDAWRGSAAGKVFGW